MLVAKSIPKSGGAAAIVAVGERTIGGGDVVVEGSVAFAGSGTRTKDSGGGGGVGSSGLRLSGLRAVARALAAAGNEHRLAILRRLLRGSVGYRSLAACTGLKPGPLYHHIRQLRLAGLILPERRDVYELTGGGRNLILLTAAAARLMTDAKPQSASRRLRAPRTRITRGARGRGNRA